MKLKGKQSVLVILLLLLLMPGIFSSNFRLTTFLPPLIALLVIYPQYKQKWQAYLSGLFAICVMLLQGLVILGIYHSEANKTLQFKEVFLLQLFLALCADIWVLSYARRSIKALRG